MFGFVLAVFVLGDGVFVGVLAARRIQPGFERCVTIEKVVDQADELIVCRFDARHKLGRLCGSFQPATPLLKHSVIS